MNKFWAPLVPLLYAGYWTRVVIADVYGKPLFSGILLFLSLVLCALVTIISGILLLFKRNKKMRISCFYWASVTMFVVFLIYSYHHMFHWGLKLRIENEEKFAVCKKEAMRIDEEFFYNVCESNDMTLLATNNVFRDIVYDSSDQLVFNPGKRPRIRGSFLSSDADDHEDIRKVADHFYVVTTTF